MPFQPTNEIVAQAFLRTVPGIDPARVVTTLPKNDAVVALGVVQTVTLGGTPDMYVAWHNPVVTVTGWAVNPGSGKPPWGKANQLLELVRVECLNHPAFPKLLNLSGFGDYHNARAWSAYLVVEPHRVPSDDGSYARYETEMWLHWVTVEV